MTDNDKQHLFANEDNSGWTSSPSPVDPAEAREADAKIDKLASEGQGPSATNELKLGGSVVEGSASKNG
jgi:hypothetical protein